MYMRSVCWRLLAGFAVLGCVPVTGAPSPASDDRAALRHEIDSLLDAPDVRHARWGVLIVDPVRGDTLYSRDAGKLLVPASNQKILTSAVALDVLGPDFRFRTPVLARGERRDSALLGDLLIAGRGDPSVSDRIAGDAMFPLRAIADSLKSHGIRHVRGRVLPHGNAFPDANVGHAWEYDDLSTSSGAAFDELLFNEGIASIHVRGGANPGDPPHARTSPASTVPRLRVEATTVARGTGRDSLPQLTAVKDTARGEVVVSGTVPAGDSASMTVTYRDPSDAFISALKQALHERGITVSDSVFPMGGSIDTLFVMSSPPLSDILPPFMKPSQNQIGEMLFKAIALQGTDTGAGRVSRRIIGERLRSWGAASDGFLVWDGSGLSRQDLVSPETLVRVLDAMRRSPHFLVYYDAFPVAGVDGTLRTRMRGTAGEFNVRGKTGTLSNARSLSGYVTTADGRMLLYSILCNHYLVPTDYISRVQDTIAVRLSRLRGGAGGSR
jgi:D-alanyl-D-alanine carboxypeptidase/D-alanyl-D-alanine-endopeptidase (penicillin-binding protein 4)